MAALCCGLAVITLVQSLSPPAPPLATVLVPARTLPAGTQVSAADLRAVEVPAELAPPGVITDLQAVVGRTPVVSLEAGVPLSASLVAGGSVAALAPPGTVVVPVRLDEQTADLLRPGDHVTLVSTSWDGETVNVLAERALALPNERSPGVDGGGGLLGGLAPAVPAAPLVLLAVDPREAPALSAASTAGAVAAVLVP